MNAFLTPINTKRIGRVISGALKNWGTPGHYVVITVPRKGDYIDVNGDSLASSITSHQTVISLLQKQITMLQAEIDGHPSISEGEDDIEDADLVDQNTD